MSERDVFYLWHLEHLGLISRTTDGWTAPLWDDARGQEAVTVAIIDSGLDHLHPNLEAALVKPQVDFGPRITGAVYRSAISTVAALRQALTTSQGDLRAIVQGVLEEVGKHTALTGLDFARLSQMHDAVQAADNPVPAAQEFLAALSVQPLGLSEADPAFHDAPAKLAELDLEDDQIVAITTLVGQMSTGHAQIDVPDPAQYFGTHATACAGLVGGRPPRDRPHEFFSALPYYGVNPFCRIASYATPYSHEIKPVINALLVAYLSEAPVILMPRGLPDAMARAALPPSARRRTRIEARDTVHPETLVDDDRANLLALESDQHLVEALLRAIAKRRYLVLAAGNEGRVTGLAYPASVAGLADSAIVVAAVTRAGQRASYSNGAPDPATLLHMVSDDAEILHREDQRIDAGSFNGSDYHVEGVDAAAAAAKYAPWAPLSLDVRGPYGFAASAHRDVPNDGDGIDIASLYTLFGGTSAAASQAAGLVSLLLQAGKLPIIPEGGVRPVITAMQAAGLRCVLPIA